MGSVTRCLLVAVLTSVLGGASAHAQIRPQVTPKPKKPAPTKPAKPAEVRKPLPRGPAKAQEAVPQPVKAPEPPQIIVETSPNAEVYLDDQFVGRASAQGRLVIANPRPGDRTVRVSLSGKRDYGATVTVVAGQETRIEAALEDLSPTAGAVKENPKDGLKYVWIPPGSFMMGCSPGDGECGGDEKPAHRVTITKGFWLGQTEVTVGAYKRFANGTGRGMPPAPDFNPSWSNEQMPIVFVSWEDADAYCRWAGGRLPSEAEWEYAARGGRTEARYGNLDEIAWYSQNSGGQTHQVAQKRPNGFGLSDVLGNVWEWVNDWYGDNYYTGSPERDPQGPGSGNSRVLRGGSWVDFPGYARVSDRDWFGPDDRVEFNGFRCWREVDVP